jgi:hypothetical protein
MRVGTLYQKAVHHLESGEVVHIESRPWLELKNYYTDSSLQKVLIAWLLSKNLSIVGQNLNAEGNYTHGVDG